MNTIKNIAIKIRKKLKFIEINIKKIIKKK